MKATVLAESFYFICFYRAFSALAMSTDVRQVGVALFTSFQKIVCHIWEIEEG